MRSKRVGLHAAVFTMIVLSLSVGWLVGYLEPYLNVWWTWGVRLMLTLGLVDLLWCYWQWLRLSWTRPSVYTIGRIKPVYQPDQEHGE